MIQSDAELTQSLHQLLYVYRALAHHRAEISPLNYANFELLTEGPIDEIKMLRSEIDEHLGIRDFAGTGRFVTSATRTSS